MMEGICHTEAMSVPTASTAVSAALVCTQGGQTGHQRRHAPAIVIAQPINLLHTLVGLAAALARRALALPTVAHGPA